MTAERNKTDETILDSKLNDLISQKKYLQIEHERFQNAQIEPNINNWDFPNLRIVQRQYSTHFFHHYTAKFIPQIPQNIIKTFGKKNDIVFDPFLGSGTTITEAKLLGHRSAGIEINPVGFKIAKAKVTSVDLTKVNDFLKWLSAKRIEKEKINDVSLFEDSNLWFRKDVSFKIHNILNKIKDLDKDTKNFIEIGLSDNLKGMSNAMMHRTVPTLPPSSKYIDRKHYDRPIDNETRNIDVYGRVLAQVIRMRFALEYLNLRSKDISATPIMGDSRNLIKHLNDIGIERTNIIITSPPYWNAQNYQELHSLSMKLFNLEFPKFGEIGRSREAYLKDMERVTEQLSEITKGVFAIVIGEDDTDDKHHEKIFDMIRSNGFDPIKSVRREISNQVGFTKSISHEYIYIFKKP